MCPNEEPVRLQSVSGDLGRDVRRVTLDVLRTDALSVKV